MFQNQHLRDTIKEEEYHSTKLLNSNTVNIPKYNCDKNNEYQESEEIDYEHTHLRLIVQFVEI